jgi:hypothetical protein
MISGSLGRRVELFFVCREARRSTPMMAAARSIRSCRSILFLFAMLGAPIAARSDTLEDSARELARKIAASLPARSDVSLAIQNSSSLVPEEVAQIERALNAELPDRGVGKSATGFVRALVAVTLSENLKSFVWTAEIHAFDTDKVVFTIIPRPIGNRVVPSAMPLTIRSERFWEGPEHILDAGEISNGAGKSWLVLLLPVGLQIQDKQTGSASTFEIASNQSASRDPWGNLNFEQIGNTIGFFLSPRVCTVNLETPNLDGCLPTSGSAEGSPASRLPVMFDTAPPGPPPPGKGTIIEMRSLCGLANQFLATSARDYTQMDSLQVFQTESAGAVAVSTELDFPGPITALHAVSDTPRAVVRNLTTGNYEAYRLSFSCGQ